jgi:hypothetical protein
MDAAARRISMRSRIVYGFLLGGKRLSTTTTAHGFRGESFDVATPKLRWDYGIHSITTTTTGGDSRLMIGLV